MHTEYTNLKKEKGIRFGGLINACAVLAQVNITAINGGAFCRFYHRVLATHMCFIFNVVIKGKSLYTYEVLYDIL